MDINIGDKVVLFLGRRPSKKNIFNNITTGECVQVCKERGLYRIKYKCEFGTTSGWYGLDNLARDKNEWIAKNQ